jgi:ferritin-like metal-binding protein YciE
MQINNPKELFVFMLSDVRRGAEQSTNFFRELHKLAQDPAVKEALEARLFVSDKIIQTLDKCFEYVGEKPVQTTGRLYDVFVEDFRKEFAEIQNPAAKRLFLLMKINRIIQLRIGEYVALIAAADSTQHYGVGVLLESCLADKLAFVERTKRLILQQVRKVAAA